MSTTATARRFRPELVPSLVTAAFLPLLVWLGLWQLNRWEEQSTMHAWFDSADAVATLAELHDDPQPFQRAQVKGRFDDRQFLIDNITENSRVGYYVITPMKLVDGRTLLVNRGWVPADPARVVLPSIETTRSLRDVSGRVGKLPSAGLKLDSGKADDSWPSVRQFPDVAELQAALDTALLPWVLLLDESADDGYVRNWRPPGLSPERHLGYAVQWFALAATLIVLWVVLSYRKRER
ncbi:MAG: SURF1 family protein [Pseudomonadota bacterium]